MKKRSMKKRWNMCQAFLLAVVLTCSGVSFMPAQVQAETVTEGFSTESRINTWDFSAESQLSSDFSLYHRNSDSTSFSVSGGCLYASTSTTTGGNDFRKAVLDTEYEVDAVSVDVYPVSGVYQGGIMLGVQPNDSGAIVGGVSGNPAILVEVIDAGTGGPGYSLAVTGITGGKQYVLLNKTLSSLLYTDNNAQAVNLSVEISGTMLTITVKVISNTAIIVDDGILSYTVNLADYTDASFDARNLEGKVGLFARVVATQFDNFTVTAPAGTYAEKNYDFVDATQLDNNFSIYKRNSDSTSFSVSGGCLYASTSTTTGGNDFRKAVLDTEYEVDAVSVDVYPVSGVYQGGIMLGVQPNDSGAIVGGVSGNPAILVEVIDAGTGGPGYSLVVTGITGGKQYVLLNKTLSSLLYTDNNAQAVNLTVEISETTLTITLKVISETATIVNDGIEQCKVELADYTGASFDARSLEGKVGLFARVAAAKFDNFTLSRKLYYDTSEMVAQTRPNETNSSEKDVRLLAYVDKLEDYKSVSFVLKSGDKTSKELVCTTAYKRVYAGGELTDTTEIYGQDGYYVTVLITNYTGSDMLNGQDVTVTTTWTKTDETQITSTRVINVSK